MEAVIALAVLWLAASIGRIQGKPFCNWELALLDGALFVGRELIKLGLGTLTGLVVLGLFTKYDFALWVGQLATWLRN